MSGLREDDQLRLATSKNREYQQPQALLSLIGHPVCIETIARVEPIITALGYQTRHFMITYPWILYSESFDSQRGSVPVFASIQQYD